jgi:hypothetical protein
MRQIVSLGLLLALAGCGEGYQAWYSPPFSTGSNPNLPVMDSENMRRVQGMTANVQPLTPEPGDVWPGPIKPPPTLQDIEKLGTPGTTALPQVSPGSAPAPSQSLYPPLPSQAPSTMLPGQSSKTGVPNIMAPNPMAPNVSTPSQTPPPPAQGTSIPTLKGPGTITGGTSGYQTLTTPGGGQSIVVPNGNGTSTIIHPDGTVETVPTPKQ